MAAEKTIFQGNVTSEVWPGDTAIICTDEQFVTVQVHTAKSSFVDTIYSNPRQFPGYGEYKVYVGKDNKLTTVGAGTYTILVGNN